MKVAHHLGLGDAIICAPIIAKLASENDEVIIPSWPHNIDSVQSFFINYPNVKVVAVTDHNQYMADFADAELKLGVYSKSKHQLPDENFVMWFYRQAGMSQEERWKWCPIYEASKKCTLNYDTKNPIEESVLVSFHEQFRLKVWNEKAFLAVPLPGSILRFVKPIIECAEVHCIDSSFLHLAEALPTKGRLFYHQYARPNSTDNYQFRNNWTIIK